MYPKFKTNLIGLAVALGFVVVGFGLGEAPRSSLPVEIPPPALVQVDATPQLAQASDDEASASRPARRGALKRHLALPYVSFAALLPRQES
ncbi:hypothetical protein [Arenimonas sp. MALMAid1274]|uniref:hypothetical protein n=1 Tax=Arenimonas sp. MALMAid1274 TaxID=3411630 RepID=UPI003BA14BEE